MIWHLNNIRRDCSCRGDSAGYSHLSCIIEYATHKFEAYLEDMEKIPCPWETCPTCLQDYTNDLAIDLAKEYVAFGEQKYARSIPTVVLHAYVLLLESLTAKNSYGVQSNMQRQGRLPTQSFQRPSMSNQQRPVDMKHLHMKYLDACFMNRREKKI